MGARDVIPPVDGGGLRAFVRESNRIENIVRDPLPREIEAHERLLARDALEVGDLVEFVAVVAEAALRAHDGMNVRVGPHVPPPGGRRIESELAEILYAVNTGSVTPFAAHVLYETLHPFMDGNGRSGRAIWLWQMLRDGRDPYVLTFQRRWYYDSLEASRAR